MSTEPKDVTLVMNGRTVRVEVTRVDVRSKKRYGLEIRVLLYKAWIGLEPKSDIHPAPSVQGDFNALTDHNSNVYARMYAFSTYTPSDAMCSLTVFVRADKPSTIPDLSLTALDRLVAPHFDKALEMLDKRALELIKEKREHHLKEESSRMAEWMMGNLAKEARQAIQFDERMKQIDEEFRDYLDVALLSDKVLDGYTKVALEGGFSKEAIEAGLAKVRVGAKTAGADMHIRMMRMDL